MDIGTIIGLLLGSGMLLWAIMGKGPLEPFMDGGSVMIVLGGAVSASLISFPLRNLLGMAKVVKNAFFAKKSDTGALSTDMVNFAENARRDGIVSL